MEEEGTRTKQMFQKIHTRRISGRLAFLSRVGYTVRLVFERSAKKSSVEHLMCLYASCPHNTVTQ